MPIGGEAIDWLGARDAGIAPTKTNVGGTPTCRLGANLLIGSVLAMWASLLHNKKRQPKLPFLTYVSNFNRLGLHTTRRIR